ncbi:DEDD exonuclease domain-containing protein [Tessaracoccus sp. MC1865]|uniref:DEDD exonuclease domain-containing protein n=1 Tax=Tessaracoccus sp. MC1865 TaxID=2760310 RepID=UPI0016025441|nr:DEDD exonuclease domain-containing protein [Tessaracoccus sp. MC1865]MBB1483631.1 DEDD exonuclease domain-containing protein [Tessaracoccus sp. MC1865]QTO36708.1 DEDD exonuclease domain-containing protein [Tessaracoccus sp. MC1865]
MSATAFSQPSFEDLGVPLPDVTFVVVDLETTGGAADSEITEFGAVKVRGGEVLGEFQTLVRPSAPIPPMIQVLTGITNQMVAGAPPLSQVLPAFAEFAAGAALVAHNARFDTGFLRRGYEQLGMTWPRPTVIDTVAVARTALMRDEVPNCKLATLARYFRATTEPNHRALSDARATVDVLHGLLARVGNLGVHTLEDLTEFALQVSPDRRAKRVWAQDAPETAGVYFFVTDSTAADGSPKREVLYVGKSNNLKRRVRSYFSAAEKRGRIHEMVRVATGVEFISCATDLEAEVRELRMIESLAPRYNRRSKNQRKLTWLKLTDEAFPRLSVVTSVRDGAPHFGPFRSRDAANEAALTLYDAFKLRRCTPRLSRKTASASCALAEMGRCLAPCELGAGAEGYGAVVEEVRSSWETDVRPVLRSVRGRLSKLVGQERYEEAGEVAERLTAYYRTSLRFHRVRSLARCRQLVAAVPSAEGWDIHVIRYGRLAAATTAPSPRARIAAEEAVALAETVLPVTGGWPAASIEEAERVASWLELPGVRLIETDGSWEWPLNAGLPEGALPRELLGEQPLSELLAS